MPAPIQELAKLHQTSALVELFTVDLTTIGSGSIFRFTPNVKPDHTSVSFGGLTYTALPIEANGFDLTASGPAPKPTLTISNVSGALMAAVVGLGDIVGAKVTRVRTYEKFLDGGSTPSSTTFIGPDIYFVEQKTAHDNTLIQFQLTSVLDRAGLRLPRRQVLKDPTPQTPEGFPGVARTRVN